MCIPIYLYIHMRVGRVPQCVWPNIPMLTQICFVFQSWILRAKWTQIYIYNNEHICMCRFSCVCIYVYIYICVVCFWTCLACRYMCVAVCVAVCCSVLQCVAVCVAVCFWACLACRTLTHISIDIYQYARAEG